MNKTLKFLTVILFSFIAVSCEVGLGSSVDTLPPELEITTPPVDSIIRDSFIIGGSWSDDGKIAGITVNLQKTDGNGEEFNINGLLTESSTVKGSGEWSALVEPVAEDGSKVIPDGSY